MPEHDPEISILDQRLAEIDQRLSRIQVGLAEEVAGDGREDPAPGRAGRPDVALTADRAARPVTLAAALPPPASRAEQSDDVDDPALVAAELRGLISDQARLLDRLAELVAAGERLFADPAPAPLRALTVPSPAAAAGHTPPAATAAGTLAVTAGPFASLDAVRAFERTLASLPGVDSAEVRGYEGGDRAVVDVHLSPTTS